MVINEEANQEFNNFPRFFCYRIAMDSIDHMMMMEKRIEGLRFIYRSVIYSETGLLDFDWLFSGPRSSFDGLFHFRRWDRLQHRFTRFEAYEFLHLAFLPLPLLFFVISPQRFIPTRERAKIIPFFFLAQAIAKTDDRVYMYIFLFSFWK